MEALYVVFGQQRVLRLGAVMRALREMLYRGVSGLDRSSISFCFPSSFSLAVALLCLTLFGLRKFINVDA